MAGNILTDLISENTAAAGVTIDGVLIKDTLDGSGAVAKTGNQTIAGVKTFSSPPLGLVTIADTEVFSGLPPNPSAWIDLDLSAVVGANPALVVVKVYDGAGGCSWAVRKNGDPDEFFAGFFSGCAAGWTGGANEHLVLLVTTDANGVIEWKCSGVGIAVTIDVMAYIK